MSLASFCGEKYPFPMNVFAKMAESGEVRMIETDATADNYFECGAIPPTFDEIMMLLSDLNSDGDPAIRVAFHSCDPGSSFVNCSNQSMDITSGYYSMIGKDSNGKAYLKICLESL